MTGDGRDSPVVTGSGDGSHWHKPAANVPFVEIQAMKRILFLTDALKINGRSVDFAAFICKLSNSSLTGVFLQHEAHNQRAAAAIRDEIACSGIAVNEKRPLHELEQECRQYTTRRFGTICENLGVRSEVIEIASRQAENILEECRYADLLLIDPGLAMGESAVVLPASFLHTILSQSECPVMMIPERFDGVDGIIYRGRYAGTVCTALFERAGDAFPILPEFSQPLSHPALSDRIHTAAHELGYTII